MSMKNLFTFIVCYLISTYAALAVDVAAIVWPAYQPEPRWAELGIFKHGCGKQ